MPFPAKAVANEFLKIAKAESKDLTPMKLQKLVYFAHGWCLALTEQPLISEHIQAWDWGPVVPSLYHEFKEYRGNPITEFGTEVRWDSELKNVVFAKPMVSNLKNPEAEFASALIRKIWDKYGGFSPIRLSNATHVNGSPWQRVYRSGERSLTIPDELIKEYFKGLIHAG